MITSYNKDLPTVSELTELLKNSSKASTFTDHPEISTLLWEDGGGNEIRIVKSDDITLILLYDNESEQNFYPDHPKRQTALREAPDEVADLIEELKPELVWSWDDTDEIWYTAAFWNLNSDWETSYDWEESHDEDSTNWMINTINDDLLK